MLLEKNTSENITENISTDTPKTSSKASRYEYLSGDWNGDGKDNIAVRRGSEIIMDFNFDKNRDKSFEFGTGRR